MKRRLLAGYLLLATLFSSSISEAGIRGPGKYSGVAVFDRWDGCTLYSGIYVMYVSESVKEELRPYSGQAIQIDAKDVWQPINPGDGLIRKFDYLGPAPESPDWVPLGGVRLRTSIKIGGDGRAIARLVVENEGEEPVRLWSGELGLTLLMKRRGQRADWDPPADGPSFAILTRQNFERVSSNPRYEGKLSIYGHPYTWTIDREHALPPQFTLAPKERRIIDVGFDLPDGEYDFLCGYGAGSHQSTLVTSNLSAFNIEKGMVVIIPEYNR